MASVYSSYANEILRSKREIISSMSFDDVIALMKGLSTLAALKPGAASMSSVDSALTTASATVAE